MKPRLLVLLLGLVVAYLASELWSMPDEKRPQLVRGEDMLAVVFGDARTVISEMMVKKADSYYHGGIDIDCKLHHEEEEDADGEEHVCDGHCGHHHRDENGGAGANFWSDPWRWINTRIRAPQLHRHLDGREAEELIPLYRAAVRMDKHNLDAWDTLIWIAARDLNDDELARRTIEEAKAANPKSPEIAFSEARFLRQGSNADLSAARREFSRAKALILERNQHHTAEEYSEDDRALLRLIEVFLSESR